VQLCIEFNPQDRWNHMLHLIGPARTKQAVAAFLGRRKPRFKGR
jgi:hypothetical protein